jgi:hypothetical protein
VRKNTRKGRKKVCRVKKRKEEKDMWEKDRKIVRTVEGNK